MSKRAAPIRWTDGEEQTLRRLWPDCSAPNIARAIGRTAVAVRSRAKVLRLKKRHQPKTWMPKEDIKLAELYPDTPMSTLTHEFNCSPNCIYNRASKLGIKRSAEFLQTADDSRRIKPGERRGVSSEFKPGHTPWNKGRHTHAGGNSVKTQFKPGRKPQTWKPVGSERITKDGFLQRKMTDTGNTPRDWQSIHRLVWEEHNGPIPKGHVIAFRDGDKRNFHIENLECISCADNMRRNSIHRLPQELKEVSYLRGRLNRQIHKRERHEKQD